MTIDYAATRRHHVIFTNTLGDTLTIGSKYYHKLKRTAFLVVHPRHTIDNILITHHSLLLPQLLLIGRLKIHINAVVSHRGPATGASRYQQLLVSHQTGGSQAILLWQRCFQIKHCTKHTGVECNTEKNTYVRAETVMPHNIPVRPERSEPPKPPLGTYRRTIASTSPEMTQISLGVLAICSQRTKSALLP